MRRTLCLLFALGGCPSRGERVDAPSPRHVPTTVVADSGSFASASDAAPVPARPPPVVNCSGTAQRVFGAECWFEGSSCDGHGGPLELPSSLQGTVVRAGAAHGGCTFTTFALVYERGTSPLRLRVCGVTPPGIECPAIADDRASWDIAPLLRENHATRAVLVAPRRARR
ncbi:MAG: hypothetical protein JNK05_36330 [Myxococcales bacterium]|nr:hypothetical protein [Myxococcales bacterium]